MLNEAASKSLTRVMNHFDRNSFAIISASRGIYSKVENEERTRNLMNDVRSAGYGFVKMSGRYIEGFGTEGEKTPVHEEVLFIASRPMKITVDTTPEHEADRHKEINKSYNDEFKSVMASLGEKYDQESIVFKPFGEEKAYLLGTTDIDENGNKVWPGKGNMVVAGDAGDLKAGKAGMFHTMLWKNRRTFTFESVEYAKSFFGTWADFLHKKQMNG